MADDLLFYIRVWPTYRHDNVDFDVLRWTKNSTLKSHTKAQSLALVRGFTAACSTKTLRYREKNEEPSTVRKLISRAIFLHWTNNNDYDRCVLSQSEWEREEKKCGNDKSCVWATIKLYISCAMISSTKKTLFWRMGIFFIWSQKICSSVRSVIIQSTVDFDSWPKRKCRCQQSHFRD